ncbi:MAG TPA: adenylate/guanylate cyclase domain-containing protein [Bacteroidia bacterium]|nr:adenylate/guanylate cyclase domain-containing protein [Bacteroidia bacterium]
MKSLLSVKCIGFYIIYIILIFHIDVNGQSFEDTASLKKIEINALQHQKFNSQEALKQADLLIEKSKEVKNLLFEGKGYHLKGLSCYTLFRYPEASKYLEKAKNIYEQIGYKQGLVSVTDDLAKVYSKLSYFPKASEYQKDVKNNLSLQDSLIHGEKIKQEMKVDFSKKETQLKLSEKISKEKLAKTSQELKIKEQELALANKERELQSMALLKEKAEKNEKEKLLRLAEQEKKLQNVQLAVLSKDKALKEALIANQSRELNFKNTMRVVYWVGILLLSLSLFFIYRNYKNQKINLRKLNISNHKLNREKSKTEELLHNILPVEVANELKLKGFSDAKQYDDVTVLFTDFVNFSGISENLSPTELVHEIDICFKAFDNIMQKHNLEKIKTIGDAYLAVSGLPNINHEHAKAAINAAKDLIEYMNQTNSVFGTNSKYKAGIRIGIHSGPVVAGIVGVKKFAYDIWGDTVNTAARLEQNSEAGKINVSYSTYELTKHYFTFETRGKIPAKNKGMIEMYYLIN